MIRLIMNETCFAKNMFILSMIETTSRGSFDHDEMKHIQNGRHAERPQVPIRFKIWPIMRPNVLLKYGFSNTMAIIDEGLKAEYLGKHRHET